MKKRVLSAACILLVLMMAGCESKNEAANTDTEVTAIDNTQSVINYHLADKNEAVACYLSNEEYFTDSSICNIQYKTQNKNGTLEEMKEYGVSQMEEFTDKEKEVLNKTLKEMEDDAIDNGYKLPPLDEIIFIKSTQEEECGSGAYTHGTQIYLGQSILNLICSNDENMRIYGKSILWHEIFHCYTRNNPDFRKDMYSIIHFTVQDQEYVLPDSVYEKYISNPDVEHHDAYASFEIDGETIDCYVALIATEPFEQEGDSFFNCMATAIIPVDGSDVYYLPEDTENFWEIFGQNTGYVIDPEECLADNFSYALTYGRDGMEYSDPEIIDAILDYVTK